MGLWQHYETSIKISINTTGYTVAARRANGCVQEWIKSKPMCATYSLCGDLSSFVVVKSSDVKCGTTKPAYKSVVVICDAMKCNVVKCAL